MDGNFARMRDDLVVVVDERRPKIDEDVDDEHDVHCQYKSNIGSLVNPKLRHSILILSASDL